MALVELRLSSMLPASERAVPVAAVRTIELVAPAAMSAIVVLVTPAKVWLAEAASLSW